MLLSFHSSFLGVKDYDVNHDTQNVFTRYEDVRNRVSSSEKSNTYKTIVWSFWGLI